MPPAGFQTFFDVSQDWGELLIPLLLTIGWLLGYFVVIKVVRSSSSSGGPRVFLWVWLTGWTVGGGFGFGNVWYQHFRCVRQLRSGNCRVVEGPITSFRPEQGKVSEQFAVGGVTFEYYSANLGGGGMRSSGGASGPLHAGTYVRVAYDTDGAILRLEVCQPH